MEDKILRGYSILGCALWEGTNTELPAQSAIVAVKSIPYTRVFLGVGRGRDEDDIYRAVAGLGDELSFEWIERLYLMMKKEREDNADNQEN